MRQFDDVLIGAGPAATGYCAALLDAPDAARRSMLIVGGGSASLPYFRASKFAPSDVARHSAEPGFGLPAVRAFGHGGSTRLWHGGFFVPCAQDEIVSGSGAKVDLSMQLQALLGSESARRLPIGPALNLISREAARTADDPWRTVIRATVPPLISPLLMPPFLRQVYDDGVAIGVRRTAGGVWLTTIAGRAGVETIESERVVVAAGCLGSLQLLSASVDLSNVSFSDHIHVFVGVFDRRSAPVALGRRLGVKRTGTRGYTRQEIWKQRITTASVDADVGLSFRAVANPEFPRSGRKFGQFLASRGTGVSNKIALALAHPITAAELLFYKFGIELPFDAYLVHATVSPRAAVGRLVQANLQFAPENAALAEAALIAFERFTRRFGLECARGTKAFSQDSVASSIISGAQFSGNVDPDRFAPIGLHIIDTTSMRFTSIYNQGLLSLLTGYGHGQRLR